jgi:hypothetical protein
MKTLILFTAFAFLIASCSLSAEDLYTEEAIEDVSPNVETVSGSDLTSLDLENTFEFTSIPSEVKKDVNIGTSIIYAEQSVENLFKFVKVYQDATTKISPFTWSEGQKKYTLKVSATPDYFVFEALIDGELLFKSNVGKNYRSAYVEMNYKTWFKLNYGNFSSIKSGKYFSNYKIKATGEVKVDVYIKYESNKNEAETICHLTKKEDGSGNSLVETKINKEPILTQSFAKQWTADGKIISND